MNIIDSEKKKSRFQNHFKKLLFVSESIFSPHPYQLLTLMSNKSLEGQ